MLKSELIKEIAHKTALDPDKSEELIDFFFNNIIHELSGNGRVEIRGFGVFTARKYKAYEGRNPKTGQKVAVGPKYAPFWETGKQLCKRVATGGKTHDTDEG